MTTDPTPIRKRLVSEWGLPTKDDLPVAVVYPDDRRGVRWHYGPTPNVVAWWPLNLSDDIEPPTPPPVPEGWRDLAELPDRHEGYVWFAGPKGVQREWGTHRKFDEQQGRRCWRPAEPPANPYAEEA